MSQELEAVRYEIVSLKDELKSEIKKILDRTIDNESNIVELKATLSLHSKELEARSKDISENRKALFELNGFFSAMVEQAKGMKSDLEEIRDTGKFTAQALNELIPIKARMQEQEENRKWWVRTVIIPLLITFVLFSISLIFKSLGLKL